MDWNWFLSNKEWVFSGAGVAIITLAVSFFRNKRNGRAGTTKTAVAGDNSKIIQSDGNVTIGSNPKDTK